MRTAFKCRAYPTPEQAAILSRTFGCVRKVWNVTLDWRHRRWYQHKQSTSMAQANAFLTAIKRDPDYAYLNDVSSVPLQQVLLTQQKAFGNFFANRARYPRFKSRSGRQSAEYTRSAFRWRDGQLWLAKMDTPLQLLWSWLDIDPVTLNPSTVTISREPDGRVVVIEDLNVAGMVRNRRLAKAISDASWAELRRQLEYKAAKYGRSLVVVDRWYPSSRTCSSCGYHLDELSLSTRHWRCPVCGSLHDRDLNAAKNILAAGLAVTACGADVRHARLPGVHSAPKQEPQPARAGLPHR